MIFDERQNLTNLAKSSCVLVGQKNKATTTCLLWDVPPGPLRGGAVIPCLDREDTQPQVAFHMGRGKNKKKKKAQGFPVMDTHKKTSHE